MPIQGLPTGPFSFPRFRGLSLASNPVAGGAPGAPQVGTTVGSANNAANLAAAQAALAATRTAAAAPVLAKPVKKQLNPEEWMARYNAIHGSGGRGASSGYGGSARGGPGGMGSSARGMGGGSKG